MKTRARTHTHVHYTSDQGFPHELAHSYRLGHVNDSNLSTCPTWLLLIPSTSSSRSSSSSSSSSSWSPPLLVSSSLFLAFRILLHRHLLCINFSSVPPKWSISPGAICLLKPGRVHRDNYPVSLSLHFWFSFCVFSLFQGAQPGWKTITVSVAMAKWGSKDLLRLDALRSLLSVFVFASMFLDLGNKISGFVANGSAWLNPSFLFWMEYQWAPPK